MEIKILEMQLRNFKGVRDLTVDFDDITNIIGDNATFKSTIFDAFTWLSWGKNSFDKKDFNIKTLDKNNQAIPKLEHEVMAILSLDGRHIKLARILKEKWTKKRGSLTSEFTGHETEYFADDVPLSQSQFDEKINSFLNENIAKLITNPLYFNQMDWKNRRVVLEAIAGEITNNTILEKIATSQNGSAIANLTNILGSGKKLDDYKKEIAVKKKKIKDQLETIPTRIDESNRSMPQVQDYAAIESQIKSKVGQIEAIEVEMENKSKSFQTVFDAIRVKQEALNDLKIQYGQAESKNKSAKSNTLADLDGKIRSAETIHSNFQSELEENIKSIQVNREKIETLNGENSKLRDKWEVENAKELVINEHEFNCPTCQQLLPEGDREKRRATLTANFNTNKSKILNDIEQSGQNNKSTITQLETKNSALVDSQVTLKEKMEDGYKALKAFKDERTKVYSEVVGESPEMLDLKSKIDAFVIPPSPVIDNSELKNKKMVISSEIDSLKEALSSREQIAKINARIQELETEEGTLSQELADLENTEFTIDAFSKAKIETLESKINHRFSLVKFKMFEQQINGGESECCECMVNGVPYSDVNTAGKINAGIDIINTLTEHYKVNAPVWVDNRESTIRILPCKSQIINLVAQKDAKLTITKQSNKELAA